MKVLIKELAHHHRLNPDQLVAFAIEYHNKYGVFDHEKDPVNNAKTSTWFSDHLVDDFKKANRKGHDWREKLQEDVNITDPALAQKYSNAQAQLAAKDKQINSLQQQINRINNEKIELEKAKGAIMQQAAAQQGQNQKQAAEQQKQAATQAAQDAAAGKVNPPATTPQNSSYPDILQRVEDINEEDDIRMTNRPMDWHKHHDMRNWYEKPVTGGHKEKIRTPKPKQMDWKRREKIMDMEGEIQDLKQDIKSVMANFQAPDYEGIDGEIENFFGEIGPEGSEILNSGAYKNDKEKIKALKNAGIESPDQILATYYYYYPEFDESKTKERKKAEKEVEKLQNKIDKIQAKIDKWEEIYESLNESSAGSYIQKLEAEYDKLSDELAILINEKAPKSSIDAIKQELREINQEIRDIEEQDELERARDEEQYAQEQEEIERDYYNRQPAEGEYESFNPASGGSFYSLNEDYVEIEGEKKTPEGYLEKDYVFYIRAIEEGEEFIGKIFKDSPDEDWFGKVVVGESDTFEKMSYQPDYNEMDIVDFLAETYEDVEIVDEEDYEDQFED